jgi:hypothetical protein
VVLELVEALPPHLPVGLEPGVQLHQWLNPDAIQATLPDRTDIDEPGVAQYAEVLRHGWLTHRQSLDQCTHRSLPAAQLVEDLSSAWLGNNLDRALS